MKNHSPTNDAAISSRSAFTLIELLIVITIIVILAALTLAGVTRAKMAAQRIACINNLKQWGCAAQLYAHDNNDQLPREAAVDGINTWEMTGDSTNRDVWYNALAEVTGIPTMACYSQTPSSQQDFYLSGKIFHCPAARFSPVSATYPNFSLAINSKLMRDFEERTEPGPPLSDLWGRKLSEIRVPDRTALFLDNGIPAEERFCEFQTAYTGQPKAFANQFPARHNRAGNMGFVSGRVRTMRCKEVVDTDPASIYRGRALYPGEVIWRHDPALVP